MADYIHALPYPMSEKRSSHRGEHGCPDLSVVVVSYNTVALLERMFAALKVARGNLRLEIIVVDNGSRDGSAEFLRANFPDIELIENSRNVGFGRANNQAIARAKGRYILLLNTDAFVAPDTLSTTLDYMETDPLCGVLGVKLVGLDGTLQPCCRYFPTPWNVFLQSTGLRRLSPNTRLVDDMSWDHNGIRQCDWVPGCYYLMRREIVDRIGMFDPRYFLYYEEVDHCRRVREAGWRVIFFPNTQVIHIGGESAKSEGKLKDVSRQLSPLQIESELLYLRKHFGLFGLLTSILLTTLTNIAIASKQLFIHQNVVRVKIALSTITQTIGALISTRLASQSTR
jgi:N-acetylglucosaminyl-diphospho-decaprenol L-rhamnosyltransferase